MTLLSLTAYAETHGVKKQSASEWKAKGLLVLAGDMVDLEQSDARMQAAGKGRFRVKAHGGRRFEGQRGIVDRPGIGMVGAVQSPPPDPVPEPWHSDDPTMFGVAMRNEVGALAAEVKLATGVDVDVDALLDMADGALEDEWDARCQTKGWYEWPATIASALAREFGLAGQAEKLAASLQRHTVARLTALSLGPEDFTDPSLPAR